MALVPDGYDGRFRFVGTVLESPEHGPQLCSVVAASFPPQCGGPDVVDWSWDGLGAESVNGTTWGSYLVVGTWDGERLHLTEPARADDGQTEHLDAHPQDFTSPCPPPEGGWRPVDRARTTTDAFERVSAVATAEPDFAGLWVDHIGEPQETEFSPVVLNVAFTGDLDRHEADLGTAWDGPLCVVEYERTLDELIRIQSELQRVTEELGLEMLWSDAGEYTNHVELGVVFIDEATQAEIDRRYGPGAVRVTAALQPISE